VEPVTHALSSLVLARAVEHRLPRFGAMMLLVSGVVADLDYLSYFGGAGAFLKFHRAVLHSLHGSAVLILGVAAFFFWLDRKVPAKKAYLPLRFVAAISFCCLGVAWHLVLDFCSGEPVQLFWPFRVTSSAWNFGPNFDPWILALVLAGLMLPQLFRLVNEEIAGHKSRGGRRGALITLGLLLAYLSARGLLHRRAEDLLRSREYHGRTPVFVGAFPKSISPFEWRGVVFTDDSIEELELSLAPGAEFDADRSLSHLKPEESPALDAGESTSIAKQFLEYARFPLASVSPLENGTRFELRDLQFAREDISPANIFVRVDFDPNMQVKQAEYLFASSRRR
jgi:membrane-bound metal-dependent hydrolase YbcI (DUF457 family)